MSSRDHLNGKLSHDGWHLSPSFVVLYISLPCRSVCHTRFVTQPQWRWLQPWYEYKCTNYRSLSWFASTILLVGSLSKHLLSTISFIFNIFQRLISFHVLLLHCSQAQLNWRFSHTLEEKFISGFLFCF